MDALTEQLAALLHAHASSDMQERLQGQGSPLSQAEVIDNLAMRLASRSREHRRAQTEGDVTAKRFADENYSMQVAEAQQLKHNADGLLNSGYARDLTELENIKAIALALKALAEQWHKDANTNLPKMSRLYLCADIIVAWKLITGDKSMPRRGRDGDSMSTVFPYFLESFVALAAPHLNPDNLHKSILTAEAEMQ